VALGLVLLLGTAACGDDGDETGGNDLPADDSLADAPTTTEGDDDEGSADAGDCPFDAAEASDATGWDLAEVEPGGGDGRPVRCAFEDGTDSVTVTELPDDTDLADVNESFEGSGDEFYADLPDLGEDGFVAYIQTSSTPETDDVIYQADVYAELDDGVVVVTLLGFSNEDDRDAAVDGVAQLLGG
jgi:hypothetical protein